MLRQNPGHRIRYRFPSDPARSDRPTQSDWIPGFANLVVSDFRFPLRFQWCLIIGIGEIFSSIVRSVSHVIRKNYLSHEYLIRAPSRVKFDLWIAVRFNWLLFPVRYVTAHSSKSRMDWLEYTLKNKSTLPNPQKGFVLVKKLPNDMKSLKKRLFKSTKP